MSSIVESMQFRYATKIFDKTKKIAPKDLDALLEVLRLSASSYGLQPWKFLVIKNEELRAKILPLAYNQTQVVDASDLIILCRKTSMDENEFEAFVTDTASTRALPRENLEAFKAMLLKTIGKMDQPKKEAWMKNQLYIALGSLLMASAHMRIDACPMEGFSPKGVDEVLGLSEMGLASVLLCPVGYRDSNDKYAALKKVRFSKDKVIQFI